MVPFFWSMIMLNSVMLVSDTALIWNDPTNQWGLAPFYIVQVFGIWMGIKGLKKLKQGDED
jgi:hypothetical protein